MKEINEYQQDLASIRAIMERSVKFVSLSGLSGVLAGMYAIAGAVAAYFVIYYPNSPFGFRFYYINETATLIQLFSIALVVLVASLLTGYWMSARKAKKLGIPVWDNTSRQLLMDLLIPLATGGIFIIILALRGYFVIIASACLLFYGLALINASGRTFKEIKYLGLLEIVLGLTSSLYPGYGLIFLGNRIWRIAYYLRHFNALSLRQVKNPFDNLDKTLEHRVRLQIMSVLLANEFADFNSLKEMLGITDGNLASHMKALEKEKYISVNKSFADRKPVTKYKATEKGRTNFRKHLDALEEILKQQKK